MHNGKELVAGQQQTPGSKMPGSLWKTTKTSCEKAKETNKSLSSVAPDMKAEWKMPLEKKNSLTSDNSKNKFACADEFNSNEEVLGKMFYISFMAYWRMFYGTEWNISSF